MNKMIMKYIRTEKGFTIFPSSYQHREIAKGCCNESIPPISAGSFVMTSDYPGLYVKCFGDSLTLGYSALDEDSDLLMHQLTEV